ncbi:site-specific integrase [Rhodococcus wratislaviensis]|nr:site-specific integrase [Rhodococcus wratislaviensis]
MRYLAETERSPNTFKAHANELKDWFTLLRTRECDWHRVSLEYVYEIVR